MKKMIAFRCDFSVGDLIDNKYVINKILGVGSYGNVYRVTDLHGKVWALKLLRLWDEPSELHDNLVARFKMEFHTSRIDSKYLIHSFEYGIVEGNPYLVMEYCPKGDLAHNKDVLKNLSPLARDVLLGLHDLHKSGKVHRDLKPENVLIKEDGQAALTDFGIVGDKQSSLTQKNWINKRPKQIFGTYFYMAPEQADRKGGGVTYLPTTDIFSFGVMIYEIITNGNFPFGMLDSFEDIEPYQRNARLGIWNKSLLKRSEIGRIWYPIIEKCITPDYRERYQSASEVLKELPQMHLDITIHKSGARIRKLRIVYGIEFGKTYDLDNLLTGRRKMLHVGRGDDNDIVLMEEWTSFVSRYHCTLEQGQEDHLWYIKDGQWNKEQQRWVESTNGTYVNSSPVYSQRMILRGGDVITIGDLKLIAETE